MQSGITSDLKSSWKIFSVSVNHIPIKRSKYFSSTFQIIQNCAFYFPANYLCTLFWQIMCQISWIICTNYVNCLMLWHNIAYEQKCLKCWSLLRFQIFFSSTFNTKLSIFKPKTRERKLFCRQIGLLIWWWWWWLLLLLY